MRTRLGRTARIAGAVALLCGVLAAPASADTTYPNGGANFTNGAEGWIDQGGSCTLLGLLPIPVPLVCAATNAHAAGEGNTPGSISSSYQALANALGVLSGKSQWRSPSFVVDKNPTGGFFTVDRRAAIQALLQVGGQAKSTVTLVDETAPARSRVLLSETLTRDTPFGQPRVVEVPEGGTNGLRNGDKYHIQIVTEFTSTGIQAAQGTITVFYDNIGLRVFDDTDTGDVPPVVATLIATDVAGETATLNASVNPKGLQTSTSFDVREEGSQSATNYPAADAGSGTVATRVSLPVTGLKKCTTYVYAAIGTNAKGTTRGNDSAFTTECAPGATTLPAAPVSANAAGLNASVAPNGPETTFQYEISTNPDLAGANFTDVRVAGSGRDVKQPLTESLTLPSNTTFYYRVIARNANGETKGNIVSFKTGVPSGPGAPGAPGARGPQGNSGVGSSGDLTLRNGDTRALLQIRNSLVQVGLKGKRAGQLRFKIFCRKQTGRTCAGTVKIRTIGKINPSIRGKKKARRVTFSTFEYQLAQGKSGVAITTLQPEKVELLRKRRGIGKSIGVTISVQVTDSGGNRQTIVREGKLRLVNSPR
ncbi:hypothetical protein [Conexibacter sp. SYSU D00693]|uniref:hypothetical protein n=1 Tax=Conexibacter sp. SYSU D00693 TaxID=2812560 RepID=UPI00196B20D9|nr:hypothetical protein [Conexibacter sp. SYSU D00693]